MAMPPPSVMDKIEHVVVLMMENRSLDSLLGWLYERDRPLRNIPGLKPGDRAYDGVQDLDLSKYTNEAVHLLKKPLELSLPGVLAAATWTEGDILNRDAKQQRQFLIQKLQAHSKEAPGFFNSKSDDELIGMAGAIIYLLGHGDRRLDELRQMTVDNQRNTLITVMQWLPGDASVGPTFGGPGGAGFVDDLPDVKRLAKLVIHSGTDIDA